MIGGLLLVFMTAFAVLALTKNELNITSGRKVGAESSKVIGYILVGGIVATFIIGSLGGIVALVLAILFGLMNSESVVKQR